MVCRSGATCLLCGLVALACYLNAIPCDFVFDDRLAILTNPDVQPRAPLWPLLLHDFWGKELVKEDSNKSYRPFTILSFRVHTWWTGAEPEPASFHLVNALLHAAVTAAATEVTLRLEPSTASHTTRGSDGGGDRGDAEARTQHHSRQ